MCHECVRFAKHGAGQAARQHFHPPVSAAVRRFIWERDGGNCRYCGCALLFNETSIDHVLAVTKGGTDDPGNLALSCWECNLSKGDREAPNINRFKENRARAKRRQWPYRPGDLRWEKEIVWLEDPRDMPYVREGLSSTGDRSRKPKGYSMVVAFVVLWSETPFGDSLSRSFERRFWRLQPNDFYDGGWPSEGVKTSSVVVGRKSVPGRDFE